MDEPTEKEITEAKEARIVERERLFALFSEGVALFAQYLVPEAIAEARRVIRMMYDMDLGTARSHDVLIRIMAGDAEGAKREASDAW